MSKTLRQTTYFIHSPLNVQLWRRSAEDGVATTTRINFEIRSKLSVGYLTLVAITIAIRSFELPTRY